jgi:hypothetical protein
LALASAISSATEFAGSVALTTSTLEAVAMRDTATKSFAASYGRFFFRLGRSA